MVCLSDWHLRLQSCMQAVQSYMQALEALACVADAIMDTAA